MSTEVYCGCGPDTLAKIIFTSGSTVNTRKACRRPTGCCAVNQAQMRSRHACPAERPPPKILDWLPWNHVFGGSHNFNIMLANGGSLYIDDGKPTKAGFAASIRNIREQGGTILHSTCRSALRSSSPRWKRTRTLKRAYLGDCDLIFYAAASVPQEIWAGLGELRQGGERRGAVDVLGLGYVGNGARGSPDA